MTHQEFVCILTPLVITMRTEFDKPTWTAYFRALSDVPGTLLALVVEREIRSPREFFPKAGELRAAAERLRREMLALHPWTACCECEDSPRWRAVLVDGVPRVEKCPCVGRYREKLTGLGLAGALASLPGEGAQDSETSYPTFDQLTPAVREELTTVARKKVLR